MARIETQFLGRSGCTLVTVPTELSESKHGIIRERTCVSLVGMFRTFFLLYAVINIRKFFYLC
jgi:hypothetical protein